MIQKSHFLLAAIVFTALFSCTQKRAVIDNSLKKYFDDSKADGCFTMLDNTSGEITVYNMQMDTTRVLPASTFKIINSLIGLHSGVILNDTMTIKWDGVKRPIEDWNKDMGMMEAFKVSNVPYYQEVARRIGADSMKRWIDSLHYGNMNCSGPVDSFWLNNRLKISPDEQLGLLKKLFFGQLPFRAGAQESVRQAMLRDNNTAYKLSYKTGWGVDEQRNQVGWVVGWIEENMHIYFFVTLVKSPDAGIDMVKVRMDITKGILKQKGFFEGKK
jgi:beta-lactamase class D